MLVKGELNHISLNTSTTTTISPDEKLKAKDVLRNSKSESLNLELSRNYYFKQCNALFPELYFQYSFQHTHQNVSSQLFR